MATKCYLITPKTKRITKTWTSNTLLKLIKKPYITRVINHHFIKAYSTKKLTTYGCNVLEVKDKTKHFDESIWDIVTVFYKNNCVKYRNPKKRQYAVRVLIHYLLNILNVNEQKFHERAAKKLAKFYKTKKASAMVDHGWEINELKKAGLL